VPARTRLKGAMKVFLKRDLMLRTALSFLWLFVMHWSLQFLAWSLAGSPFLSSTTQILWLVAWRILSSPLFLLFGHATTMEHFEALCVTNSAVWSVGLSMFGLWRGKRER
jgi:hypothetical protein